MAPSAALQARIRQFEALDGAGSSKHAGSEHPAYPPRRNVPRPSPASALSTPTSPPDLMSEPVSPTAASFSIIQASVPYEPRKPRVKSPSPSPPNLGCKTSLIDLRDWVVEDPPKTQAVKRDVSGDDGRSRISSPVAPPLPPRNISNRPTSITSSKSPSPLLSPLNGHAPNSKNSLAVEHTYPPLARAASMSSLRQGQGHAHASSTSSFHSVSLSSDGGTTDGSSSVSNYVATYPIDTLESSGLDHERDREKDKESVDDAFSFETVPSTGLSSPSQSSTHDWEKDIVAQLSKPAPPKLPARNPSQLLDAHIPSSSSKPLPAPILHRQSSQSPQSQSPQSSIRRVPPPPPVRQRNSANPPSARTSLISTTTSMSDRSSIFSNATVTTAHTSITNYTTLFRPPPVPAAVRIRYETLFAANIVAQTRVIESRLSANSKASSQSTRKGWRGLSVDLITNPDDHPNLSADAKIDYDNRDAKLDGHIVKQIWSRSSLPNEKLKEIWNECALPGQTYLGREGFVKGMWRIDDELRRTQVSKRSEPAGRSRPTKRTTVDSVFS